MIYLMRKKKKNVLKQVENPVANSGIYPGTVELTELVEIVQMPP